LSLHGGVGENYLSDQSTNGSDGFSSYTNITASVDNGLKPVFLTNGGNFADPIANVVKPTGSSLGYLQDLGYGVSFINPHYHIPSLWNYSLELQGQLTKRDVFTAAYVGNIMTNGTVGLDLDMYSPQWNAQCDIERGGNHNLCDGAAGQIANPFQNIAAFGTTGFFYNNTLSKSQFQRPYPEFSDVYENDATNDFRAWYNSFQASYSHQMSHSIALHVAYTHAYMMQAGGWQDELNNVRNRYLQGSNTTKHAVNISGVGYLPFGRGRDFFSNSPTWVDEIINGWEASPFLTYYSGFPWGIGGNWEEFPSGSAVTHSMAVKRTTLSPDAANHEQYKRIRGVTPCVGYKNQNYDLPDGGGPQVYVSQSSTSETTACGPSGTNTPFVTAADGYAVQRVNEFSGVYQPGAPHFDLAVSKNFAIHGVQQIFRSDVTNFKFTFDLFNALNHPNWDEGYNGCCGTDFGTIPKGPNGPTNTPRYIQLSAKLNW